MHGVSEKMKAVNSLYVSNVCQRCKDCIEWKIKYKKYKPLTVPSKCVKCSGKKVKYAYHIVCTECALQYKICAKCSKAKEVVGEPEQTKSEQQREDNQIKEELKYMRERERRTYLRQLERGEKVSEGGNNGEVNGDGSEGEDFSDDCGSDFDSGNEA